QELGAVDRQDQGVLEAGEELSRQVLVAAPVVGLETAASAGQREGVVAQLVDPELRLPELPALDAEPRANGMVDAEAEQLVRGVGLDLRHLGGLAEQQPELRSTRAELRLRPDRQVELQEPRQQEDAVDHPPAGHVEELDAAELALDGLCPVVEYLVDGRVVRDGEAQIQI